MTLLDADHPRPMPPNRHFSSVTLQLTNIGVENGPLEDSFTLRHRFLFVPLPWLVSWSVAVYGYVIQEVHSAMVFSSSFFDQDGAVFLPRQGGGGSPRASGHCHRSVGGLGAFPQRLSRGISQMYLPRISQMYIPGLLDVS